MFESCGQCAEGLICLQRDGFEPVPGCTGQGEKGGDYCYGLPPPPPAMGMADIMPIAGAGIGGVVVLGVIIGIVCCVMSKRSRANARMMGQQMPVSTSGVVMTTIGTPSSMPNEVVMQNPIALGADVKQASA